jgi:hypothetical protein
MTKFDRQEKPSIDWAFWARMPGWTVEEFASLAVGEDPELSMSSSSSLERKQTLRLLQRAVEMDEIKSPDKPIEFLRLANSGGIAIPEELKIAASNKTKIRNYRRMYRKVKTERNELRALNQDEIKPKRLHSIYLLLYTMATEKYKFKYNANNSAAKNILDDVERKGLKIDRDTIRKLLGDAAVHMAEHLPKPNSEN